jgi:hypothetical protein
VLQIVAGCKIQQWCSTLDTYAARNGCMHKFCDSVPRALLLDICNTCVYIWMHVVLRRYMLIRQLCMACMCVSAVRCLCMVLQHWTPLYTIKAPTLLRGVAHVEDAATIIWAGV